MEIKFNKRRQSHNLVHEHPHAHGEEQHVHPHPHDHSNHHSHAGDYKGPDHSDLQ